MTTNKSKATGLVGNFAPTSNISLVYDAMTQLTTRAYGMPGIGCVYGRSGLGKSAGAAFASHPSGFNGAYVCCRSIETKKSLAEQICKALGLKPKGNMAALFEMMVEALSISQRPLIVDEVDHIADTKMLELLRDLHDISNCALLLIGEENLPAKLSRHERFDNRVYIWQPAATCSSADLDLLAKHYAPGLTIDKALKDRVLAESGGITRRVVVNLENIKRWCEAQGTTEAPADAPVKLYTGRAPGRGQ